VSTSAADERGKVVSEPELSIPETLRRMALPRALCERPADLSEVQENSGDTETDVQAHGKAKPWPMASAWFRPMEIWWATSWATAILPATRAIVNRVFQRMPGGDERPFR
jgi:hypothetical protein